MSKRRRLAYDMRAAEESRPGRRSGLTTPRTRALEQRSLRDAPRCSSTCRPTACTATTSGDPQVYRSKRIARERESCESDPIQRLRDPVGTWLRTSSNAVDHRKAHPSRRGAAVRARNGNRPEAGKPRQEPRIVPGESYARESATALCPGEARRREGVHHGRGHRREGRLSMGWGSRKGGCSTKVRPGAGRNTPIPRWRIVGAGIGAAMDRDGPSVGEEIMYEDFLTLSSADRQPGGEAPIHVGRRTVDRAVAIRTRAAPVVARARSHCAHARAWSSPSRG